MARDRYNRQIDNPVPDRRTELLELLAGGPRSTGQLGLSLGLTRQAVLLHLQRLDREGLVRSSGRGRATRWERSFLRRFSWPLSPNLAEDRLWTEIKAASPEFDALPDRARSILGYAMTEMLNNAIDHSEGTEIAVTRRDTNGHLLFEVSDDGVGALHKVRQHFHLSSEREAVLHLSKGRQTTAPAKHSGQGLFFTSKLFDRFALRCENHSWFVDNTRGDQAVGPGTGSRGTLVQMELDPGTTVELRKVFDRFVDVDAPDLQRSKVGIRLAEYGGDFLSRSEARRMAHQLAVFEEVELDFSGVTTVGQGFADEIFRVWAAQNPDTRLIPVHMNEDVAFMVAWGTGRAGASGSEFGDEDRPTD
ncbi:MAG: DUF4325 domain-containing protein [Acidobacteriota bacterium]|nr:DUF4325 domain-containing protein [Acidobacteriota bacterium]